MSPRTRWLVGWGIVLVLATGTVLADRSQRGQAAAMERAPGPVQRLFGPFASLGARIQWIRFDRARIAGRLELALARAETALALDPGDTAGWNLLASHLAIERASTEREPDPRRRLAWLRAGLEVARRGELEARDPASLAFLAGYVLQLKALLDPDLPWPGGERALWAEAARAYGRAEGLGHPRAGLAAAWARERAGSD